MRGPPADDFDTGCYKCYKMAIRNDLVRANDKLDNMKNDEQDSSEESSSSEEDSSENNEFYQDCFKCFTKAIWGSINRLNGRLQQVKHKNSNPNHKNLMKLLKRLNVMDLNGAPSSGGYGTLRKHTGVSHDSSNKLS